MLSWEETRSQFDRLYCSQALDDDVSNEQVIDSYQAELVNLYDYWSKYGNLPAEYCVRPAGSGGY